MPMNAATGARNAVLHDFLVRESPCHETLKGSRGKSAVAGVDYGLRPRDEHDDWNARQSVAIDRGGKAARGTTYTADSPSWRRCDTGKTENAFLNFTAAEVVNIDYTMRLCALVPVCIMTDGARKLIAQGGIAHGFSTCWTHKRETDFGDDLRPKFPGARDRTRRGGPMPDKNGGCPRQRDRVCP